MNVAEQIDEVVDHLLRIKDFENNAAARHKLQKKRIKQLESENKALRECVDELVKQRQRDRLVIAEWQTLLNQTAVQSQLADEQGHAASSPPIIKEETQQGLGISETVDVDMPPSTQTPIPSSGSLSHETQTPSSPLATTQTQAEVAQGEEPISQGDENTTLRDVLRLDDHSSQDEMDQVNTSCNPPLGSASHAHSSPVGANDVPAVERAESNLTMQSLLEREWHPSDFVVNQNYNSHSTKKPNLSSYLMSFLTSSHSPDKELASADKNWRTVETDDIHGTKRFKHYHHEPMSVAQGVIRQESPPGFWRPEFADTQEWIKEKQDLDAALKEQANSRLKEAIQNGRFLFRNKELRDAAAAHKIK